MSLKRRDKAMERKTAWKKYDDRYKEQIFDFCEGYKAFITECKTERECTAAIRTRAEELGYERSRCPHP